MDRRLAEARDAVDSAKRLTDDSNAEEQLASIRLGLESVDDEQLDETEVGDRLEELERQIVTLGNDVEDLARSHLETARDQIDAYRRESAPEWDDDGE
ncbi:DUF7553 family protein [Halosimplex salinum]|uniref:DUF7553 family protein n=1 Tax=Halosimplex salinum TaxID=1710538 RepID=UPI000F472EA6|nr:hypothetical protein [Halosimplex salinum]